MQADLVVRLQFGDEVCNDLLLLLKTGVSLREQLTHAIARAKDCQLIEKNFDLSEAEVVIEGEHVSTLDLPPSISPCQHVGALPLIVVRTPETPVAVTIVVKSDQTNGELEELETVMVDPSSALIDELEKANIRGLLKGQRWFKKPLRSMKSLKVKSLSRKLFRRRLDVSASLWEQGIRRAEHLELYPRVWWGWPSRICLPPPLTSAALALAIAILFAVAIVIAIPPLPEFYSLEITSPTPAAIVVDGADSHVQVDTGSLPGLFSTVIDSVSPGQHKIRVYPQFSGIWDTTITAEGRWEDQLTVALDHPVREGPRTVLSAEAFQQVGGDVGQSPLRGVKVSLNYMELRVEQRTHLPPGEYVLRFEDGQDIISDKFISRMDWTVENSSVSATDPLHIVLPLRAEDSQQAIGIDLKVERP